MPVHLNVVEAINPKRPYPVLLVGRDGCVKLFVNETDGIVLKKPNGAESLALSLGGITAGTVNFNHDGTRNEHGSPIKATSDYWKRLHGEITLSND